MEDSPGGRTRPWLTFESIPCRVWKGYRPIASAERLDNLGNISAVSLVFAAGERPDASAIRALALRSRAFSISSDPQADIPGEAGWVELLASGLTFDLTGLAPAAGDLLPEQAHRFGLGANDDFGDCEALTLVPGPHLSGGAAMVPVLRCLAWIGALLAGLPGVKAVAWHPARTWSAPDYFRSGVLRWIEGGVFPGLGLTALVPRPNGGLQSEGLALFIGQELQLAPELVGEGAEGAKIALRLLNWLVENGRLTETGSMMGPGGEILRLEPVEKQRIIKVTASS